MEFRFVIPFRFANFKIHIILCFFLLTICKGISQLVTHKNSFKVLCYLSFFIFRLSEKNIFLRKCVSTVVSSVDEDNPYFFRDMFIFKKMKLLKWKRGKQLSKFMYSIYNGHVPNLLTLKLNVQKITYCQLTFPPQTLMLQPEIIQKLCGYFCIKLPQIYDPVQY